MRPPTLQHVPAIALIALAVALLSAAAHGSTPNPEAAEPPAEPPRAAELDVVPPDPADPSSAAAAARAALEALGPKVVRTSHDEALRMAFEAYYNYRDAHPDRVRKPYFYYVDLGLNNRTARGYVFDMEKLTVVDGPFTVAHGTGSSRQRNGVPASFSNRPGSKMSSLGLYLAQETYTFRGRSGGRAYSSVGLRMRGESGAFNDAARRRGIVAHGAPYVTRRDAGRSEGCPAMEQHRARRLLPMLANGGVVFIFSPNEARWLREDPWVNPRP